jgi:hypothetical protein
VAAQPRAAPRAADDTTPPPTRNPPPARRPEAPPPVEAGARTGDEEASVQVDASALEDDSTSIRPNPLHQVRPSRQGTGGAAPPRPALSRPPPKKP